MRQLQQKSVRYIVRFKSREKSQQSTTETDNGSDFVQTFRVPSSSCTIIWCRREHRWYAICIWCCNFWWGPGGTGCQLTPHQQCAPHTLKLLATNDLDKAASEGPKRKLYRSATRPRITAASDRFRQTSGIHHWDNFTSLISMSDPASFSRTCPRFPSRFCVFCVLSSSLFPFQLSLTTCSAVFPLRFYNWI